MVDGVASVGAGLGTSNSARSGPGRSPGDDGEIAEPGSGPEAPSEPGGLMTLAPVSFVTRLFERRPFEEGTFEVEGLRLNYERHGEGSRVLVFLHGLLLDNQLSRRLAADLAAEVSAQARTATGQLAQRQRLDDLRQPCYELPWITDGMDLGGLYRLAAALRDQGAA